MCAAQVHEKMMKFQYMELTFTRTKDFQTVQWLITCQSAKTSERFNETQLVFRSNQQCLNQFIAATSVPLEYKKHT